MTERVFCVALAILLAPSLASGQDVSVPQKLTLDQAVALALERNPAMAAIRADRDIAAADQLQAGLRPNPAFSFESAGFPLTSQNRPGFFDAQELTFRFDQELELGGRRGLRQRVAAAGVTAAEARIEDAKRLLTLDVQRAYFQAVLGTADRDVARASLDEIDKAIGLNRARLAQGEISGADLRRLQVERLRFVDDVFAAELALRNARSALLALMNHPGLNEEFFVVEPLAAEPAAPTVDITTPIPGIPPATIGLSGSQLAIEALTRRPDIAAARQEVARAETETRLQRALRTPNVTVGAGYMRDFGTNAVVFGTTVPLPFFNRNQGGVQRAEAVRIQAERRAEATTLRARLEIQQAANAVDINRERVRYIEREYLTAAREARDIVLASYKLGAADLIDFLDAQRAFRDTVRTYNRALYDQRISIFELAAAASLPRGR